LQSRRFAVASLTVVAVAALIGVAAVFYGNLIPTTSMTPTEVFVIIPKGAGLDLHLGFEPAKITIIIGVNNTVVWKNEDSDWHTAHSNIPEFNSGLIPPGGNFTHTFLRAGVYPYHCDPHPWMTGVVTVKAETSTGMIASPLDWQGPLSPMNRLLTGSKRYLDDQPRLFD
jgi:plastocyanin